MSSPSIRVENLSKQYRLGMVGTGTLKNDINRLWHTIRGKEDPYLKIGQTNDRTKKAESDWVWALKDINFEVQKGEVLGIIGRNGAGKSTLLKILSKITAPTTGEININGRIASLLEVGTGFHGELSGRENIFLNGAILGMRKAEIQKKFDEIVDFSGVEAYIDTPVKRYSSGMYVRLAFAVAAYLEPDILIVDEVLAVGDADFQKKCLGKMKDVSVNGGRTVLFVSHNIAAVRELCDNGLVMANGQSVFQGNIANAIDYYLETGSSSNLGQHYSALPNNKYDLQLLEAELLNTHPNNTNDYELHEAIQMKIKVNCLRAIPGLYGYINIKTKNQQLLIESDTFDHLPNCLENITPGEHTFFLKINPYTLAIGEYIIYLSFATSFTDYMSIESPGDILSFSVVDNITKRGIRRTAKTGHLIKWDNNHVK